MTTDTVVHPPRRIPTLVQHCQRVASAHVDSISSFGDDLRYDLIKPILENCSPETLLRLEHASPRIQQHTAPIWKDICFRTFAAAYFEGCVEPESWRDAYSELCAAEAKRLEEVGSRLRTQRLEEEERKNDRKIKLTDRVPPSKRSRTKPMSVGSTSTQARSLFQKTRTEASKIQKAMYNQRMISPPRPRRRSASGAADEAVSTSPSSAHVVVRTVTTRLRRPAASNASSQSAWGAAGPARSKPTPGGDGAPKPGLLVREEDYFPSPHHPPSIAAATTAAAAAAAAEPLPLKPPGGIKKDPMASLFMPKHRAHSQLPRHTVSSRTHDKRRLP